jgi:hypothetical protein
MTIVSRVARENSAIAYGGGSRHGAVVASPQHCRPEAARTESSYAPAQRFSFTSGRPTAADWCKDGMDSSRFLRGRMCRDERGRQATHQEEAEMDATTVAIDLAKDIFEVALANRAGRIIERKRLARRPFERFVDGLPAGTEIIMEACGTAHF